jgi:hypothetical protein
MLGTAPKETAVRDDLRPDSFGRSGFRTLCQKDAYGLLSVLRRREYIAECDIRQQIAVVIYIEAVDGVRMERIGVRICIEDDRRPRRPPG